MKQTIDKLKKNKTINDDELRQLILSADNAATLRYITRQARATARQKFGNKIYLRAPIEITNICTQGCYYCGLRADNTAIHRYALTQTEIIQACHNAYRQGIRTFVLQGGQTPRYTTQQLCTLIRQIHTQFPNTAITLSLGEKTDTDYQQLHQAGANRYLLRHETRQPQHYATLHPATMSLDARLHAIQTLKKTGYQTGTGMIIGTPGQTPDTLIADIRYIQQLKPQMIGLGPFIPHNQTPLKNHPHGSVNLTLMLIAIMRLMHPDALIPATTALATLTPQGTTKGINAGANVIMPCFTPQNKAEHYQIYNSKQKALTTQGQNIQKLKKTIAQIGYTTTTDKGDYKQTENNKKP